MAYAGSSRRARVRNQWAQEGAAHGTTTEGLDAPARRARGRGADAAPAGTDAEAASDDRARPRGRPFRTSLNWQRPDWGRAGAVGTGVAVGALLGAGLALLLAPQSGRATRRAIARAGTMAGHRAADAWADFGDELTYRRSRAARRFRRRLDRGRWGAEALRERLVERSREI